MSGSTSDRTKIAALFGILTLSAGTMLWLFWRFPLITGLATVAILVTLGVCARLARLSDSDIAELTQGHELDHGQPGL